MIMDLVSENILSELEKTQKEFWNVSRETGCFLNKIVELKNCKNGIEVGTSNGYSGIWLGKAFKNNNGKLTTIEFFDKRQSVARENFDKCGLAETITTKLGSACDILQEWEDKIDFAFIDANKSLYIEFFRLIDKHLVKGGVFTADNITSHPEKVKDFVKTIKEDKRYQTEILDLPAGLLVAYKIND